MYFHSSVFYSDCRHLDLPFLTHALPTRRSSVLSTRPSSSMPDDRRRSAQPPPSRRSRRPVPQRLLPPAQPPMPSPHLLSKGPARHASPAECVPPRREKA